MTRKRLASLVAAASAIALGATLRSLPVVAADFPINDGGMFATMVTEIRESALGLPAFTAYNDASIPFAYPPLALYVAAAVTAVGPSVTDVLRFLPFLFSVATIPVMYLIGMQVLSRRDVAGIAAAIFAVTTGSYEWLVMGGGLTRSLGFLTALVAILFAIRMYREGSTWAAVACGIALGATALSHPQTAVFGGLSVPLLLPFVAPARSRSVRHLLMAIVVATIVVSPWLALIILSHGLAPLVSAVGTGGGALLGVVSLVLSRTSGGYLELIGFATTVALVICCVRRFWLPPVWILAIAIADSRAGQPYLSVPAALAIAFLVEDIGRMVGRSIARRPQLAWARSVPAALAVILVTAAFFDSLASQLVPGSPLRPVPSATRSAMAWVDAETGSDARFVVLSGRYWALDAEAEWFPALAGRRSVATVQGSEWLGTYDRQVERAAQLPECVVEDDRECVADWFEGAGRVDYLFLVATPSRDLGGVSCCQQLAEQLSTMYETEVVHRDGDVLVVRLTPRSS
jgi:4-amino-4-deoxy-L-arabinose transferase-like glycosyltransferase